MSWGRAVRAAAVVAAALVAVGAAGCSPSRQSNPINIASPETTPTTVVSTEVAGTIPTGDLAFLGPVRTVPVGDITIGYRQFGTGPALLMIVGQDSSMSYWGPDLPRRLADHFTVTIFDNRGVGFTTDPASSSLTIEQMADDTSGLVDALGLDHPTVFGWSTGGEIALALAVRHPDQLARLGPIVLSGATAGGPQATPTPPELNALLASSDPADQVKLLDELFTPSGAAARDAYISGLLAMPADEVSVSAQARQADAETAFAGDTTVVDGLGSISARVLVTDGAEDRLVPTANAALIAERIPGAQLRLVPDTSHAWMLQDLDRFVATLVAFGSGQPPP